ncbi:MAG: NAD(P)-binding protein [Cytophagales bacterium]|nr:NAD(P)-binding protein [Cytophagales bacterium]
MQRRRFLQLSGVLTAGSLLPRGCDDNKIPVHLFSDHKVGHLIRQKKTWRKGKTYKTECLIVGGGLAGLSAAYHCRSRDFLLCELSTDLGGSSASHQARGVQFAQGAHYDLAYPANYGDEVLHFLRKLDIVYQDVFTGKWNFREEKYLIDPKKESRTFAHGTHRKDLLPEGKDKSVFLEALAEFEGKMPMPACLSEKRLHVLNQLTFADFLYEKHSFSREFKEAVDYQLKDDYGAGANKVSAFAGIHYYKCRPYFSEKNQLFSPSQGNDYFAKKILSQLPAGQMKARHLVCGIRPEGKSFVCQVLDVEREEIVQVNSRQVIYAGQKMALPYIFSPDASLFRSNRYAPWMVVNVLVRSKLPVSAYWQNEILSDDRRLLGFVDSGAQHDASETRVLTLYYCFSEGERYLLEQHADLKEKIAEQAIEELSAFYGVSVRNLVQEVFIKLMGHAMPIPVPGYLFDDKNLKRAHSKFVYAGVDNSRLPLLFEALDSGIQAHKYLSKNV